MIALFFSFITVALSQSLGSYTASQAACVGANNTVAQGGVCYRLRFPPNQVPAGQAQGLFAASAGVLTNGNGDKIPYAAVAGAKWLGTSQTQTNPTTNFRAAGAGLVWLYAGAGLFCDRDGTAGYQDPALTAGIDSSCYTAAARNNPNQDCILGFVRAAQSNFDPVSITSNSNVFTVRIRETNGVYDQSCYVKAAVNTNTDPTVPGSGGRTVGEWQETPLSFLSIF